MSETPKGFTPLRIQGGRQLLGRYGEPVPVRLMIRSSESAPARLKFLLVGEFGKSEFIVLSPEFRVELN
jgi:hypothetical protein